MVGSPSRAEPRLLEHTGATQEDSEGLINLPLTVQEIQAVAFFKELDPLLLASACVRRAASTSIASPGIWGRRPQERRRLHDEWLVRESAESRHRAHPRSCVIEEMGSFPYGRRHYRRQAGRSDLARCRRRRARRSSAAPDGTGKPKVGHTGTLDPLASGVLPLVIGKATRLAQFLSAADKEYVADVALGVTTTTFDRGGEFVE